MKIVVTIDYLFMKEYYSNYNVTQCTVTYTVSLNINLIQKSIIFKYVTFKNFD